MKKVILNLAVSVDGYIARNDGSVKWLDSLETDGSDLGFSKFLDSCDSIIMGRSSYETTMRLGNNEWPFKHHQSYVFTSKSLVDNEYITFLSTDPQKLILSLQKKKGKNIWLFGGSKFIESIRNCDLVDEYIITTIPVLLGEGIKLFLPSSTENQLFLKTITKTNNIVSSHYIVKR